MDLRSALESGDEGLPTLFCLKAVAKQQRSKAWAISG